MFDFETTVSGIEFKIRQLADEVQRLRDEAAAGRRRIGELEEALKDREITINNLKEENKVYKLKKSLYGLKQASRQWYYTFHNAIVKFGFRANDYDHCVYH